MHVMKQEETGEHVIGGMRRQVCKQRQVGGFGPLLVEMGWCKMLDKSNKWLSVF